MKQHLSEEIQKAHANAEYAEQEQDAEASSRHALIAQAYAAIASATAAERLVEEQRTANLLAALNAVYPDGASVYAANQSSLRGEIMSRLDMTLDGY